MVIFSSGFHMPASDGSVPSRGVTSSIVMGQGFAGASSAASNGIPSENAPTVASTSVNRMLGILALTGFAPFVLGKQMHSVSSQSTAPSFASRALS